MITENKKQKSEAQLRYEKAEASRVKKHHRALDREVENLRRQYDRNKVS